MPPPRRISRIENRIDRVVAGAHRYSRSAANCSDRRPWTLDDKRCECDALTGSLGGQWKSARRRGVPVVDKTLEVVVVPVCKQEGS